jgi:uncharacterized protein
MQLVCPNCGSAKVRGSSAHASDDLGKLLFGKSMRCHTCRKRFWIRSYAKPVLLALLLLLGLGFVIQELAGPGHSANGEISLQDALYTRVKRGDPQAELEMGMRYAQGDGLIKNETQAASWLGKASRHGSIEAQYQLGLALLEGRGVVQDYHGAFLWINKAAQKGYPPAEYSLGDLYRFGTGVELDKAKAYLWLNLAAAQGVENAAKARDSVAWQLKPDQLKAMQEEASRLSQILPNRLGEPMAVASPEAQTGAPAALPADSRFRQH